VRAKCVAVPAGVRVTIGKSTFAAMQQLCSEYAANMQQIYSKYAANMQQICSEYAAAT
jgi:hypothetical protein